MAPNVYDQFNIFSIFVITHTYHPLFNQDDGTPVSIFEYDFTQPQAKNRIPLAKNSLRKLRTLRHPDVLKFMDAVETDTTIHIMAERVKPLGGDTLGNWAGKGKQEKEDWLVWGLHRISVCFSYYYYLLRTRLCLICFLSWVLGCFGLRERFLWINAWTYPLNVHIHLTFRRVETWWV